MITSFTAQTRRYLQVKENIPNIYARITGMTYKCPRRTNPKPVYKIFKMLHDLASASLNDHISQHKSSLPFYSVLFEVLFPQYVRTYQVLCTCCVHHLPISPHAYSHESFKIQVMCHLLCWIVLDFSRWGSLILSQLHTYLVWKYPVIYLSLLFSCDILNDRNWAYTSLFLEARFDSVLEKVSRSVWE